MGMFPMKIEDRTRLRVSLTASTTNIVVLDIFVRRRGSKTPVQMELLDITGAGDRSQVLVEEFIPGGELWGVTARERTGVMKRGQAYVRIDMIPPAGGSMTFNLARGYVYAFNLLAGGEFVEPTDGKGLIRSIAGTNPSAGVEITEAVPSNARWRPLSVDTINAIGAAGINVTLTITDGTTQKWRSAIIATGTGTELIVWARQVTFNETALFSTVPILDGDMPEAFELVTAGITGDDDYAAPQLLVEEWIEV